MQLTNCRKFVIKPLEKINNGRGENFKGKKGYDLMRKITCVKNQFFKVPVKINSPSKNIVL